MAQVVHTPKYVSIGGDEVFARADRVYVSNGMPGIARRYIPITEREACERMAKHIGERIDFATLASIMLKAAIGTWNK